MKMKLIIVSMITLSVFSSCRKADTGADIDTSGYTFFDVNMESLAIDETSEKTWREGDRIGVFGSEAGTNVGYYLRTASEGNTVAEFYGPLVKGESIRAYYPYTGALDADYSNIPCELPSLQDYEPSLSATEWFKAHTTRVFASLEDGILRFTYPFGILRITVAMDESLALTGAKLSSYQDIAGIFGIDENGRLLPTSLSSDSILLDFDGSVHKSHTDGKFIELMFMLPPATYDAGELVLTLSVQDADAMTIKLHALEIRRITSSDFTIEDILVGTSDIPDLDVETGYIENK